MLLAPRKGQEHKRFVSLQPPPHPSTHTAPLSSSHLPLNPCSPFPPQRETNPRGSFKTFTSRKRGAARTSPFSPALFLLLSCQPHLHHVQLQPATPSGSRLVSSNLARKFTARFGYCEHKQSSHRVTKICCHCNINTSAGYLSSSRRVISLHCT